MTPRFPEFNHFKSNRGPLQSLEMDTMEGCSMLTAYKRLSIWAQEQRYKQHEFSGRKPLWLWLVEFMYNLCGGNMQGKNWQWFWMSGDTEWGLVALESAMYSRSLRLELVEGDWDMTDLEWQHHHKQVSWDNLKKGITSREVKSWAFHEPQVRKSWTCSR